MADSAWAVLVVSSERQAETLPYQRAWAQEAAAEKGWRLTRTFEDVSSGKAGPRKLVRRMLTELESLEAAQRPQWVMMIRLDRVGRGSIIESQMVLHELKNLGVAVWTRDGGEERLDSAMQQLIAAAKLAVSTHENEVRSDKARSTYARKRKEGKAVGNQRPYGLRINAQRVDEADEPLAEVVREAFKMRIAGYGYNAIARKLGTIAPPRVFKNGTVRVVRWTPSRIKRLLENRAYIGPILDEVTFAQAQRVTAPRTRARKHPWPLAGAIRCYCGRAMIGWNCGPTGYRKRYYGCNALWLHGKHRLILASDLEAQFVALLEKISAKPATIHAHRKAPTSPAMLERALREAHAAASQVQREREQVWSLHAKGLVRDEDVQARLDSLTTREAEQQERIAQIAADLSVLRASKARESDVQAALLKAAQTYRNASVDDQRAIARALATYTGGLVVEENGRLRARPIDDPQRQRKRRANEV